MKEALALDDKNNIKTKRVDLNQVKAPIPSFFCVTLVKTVAFLRISNNIYSRKNAAEENFLFTRIAKEDYFLPFLRYP